MLAIRMQRRGRKGHAQFRVILQDSHRSPSTGKVTAYLGSFNPHTKTAQLDVEKIDFYLKNGAQPSNRVAQLLKNEGVTLPKWVTIDTSKQGAVKNPEKYGTDKGASASADDAANSESPEEEKPAEDAAPAEEKPDEAPAEKKEESPDTADKQPEAAESKEAADDATDKKD